MTSSDALVDANVLVAAADPRDPRHVRAVQTLGGIGTVRVAVLAIAEAAYLIGRTGAIAEARFAASVAIGDIIPEPVAASDWERIARLVWEYRDLQLGTTDASIVATAERLGIGTLLTFDRRHFSVVRPLHVDAFELLPD